MSFGLRLMSGCCRVFLPDLRRPMSLCLLTISGLARPCSSWHLQQHLLVLLLLLLENHLNLVLRLWLKSISVLAPQVRRYSEDTTTMPPPPATAYKLLLNWAELCQHYVLLSWEQPAATLACSHSQKPTPVGDHFWWKSPLLTKLKSGFSQSQHYTSLSQIKWPQFDNRQHLALTNETIFF